MLRENGAPAATAPCPAAAPTGGWLPKSLGAGGAVGFLTIPALVLLLRPAMPTSVGTSLVIIVITSTAGFAAHADTALNYRIAAGFHDHRHHRLARRRTTRIPATRQTTPLRLPRVRRRRIRLGPDGD
jgi:hypothetical protein